MKVMLGVIIFSMMLITWPGHACEMDEQVPTLSSSFVAIDTTFQSSLTILLNSAGQTGDPETVIQIARTFLESYNERTDFDLKNANKIVLLLTNVGTDSQLSKELRSKAQLLLAGVHGRIADKLRQNGGAEQGNLALKAFKEALRLNPNYSDAAKAYGATIQRMADKGAVARGFIEFAMGINLETEAKTAMNALEKVDLTSTETYQALKKFLAGR